MLITTGVPVYATAALPPLKFRGLQAPGYEDASFSWSHRQAPREWPYVDGQGHAWTGMGVLKMPFRLLFLNILAPDAFPKQWYEWRTALYDGTPGDFEHPVAGLMRAVPTEVNVEATARSTSGIVVGVTFEQTVEDPTKEAGFWAVTEPLLSLAQTADLYIAAAGISYPTGQRTDSLLDLVKQVEGLAFSAKLSALGMINQALGIVSTLLGAVRNTRDHANWAAYGALLKLWDGLKNTAEEFKRTVGARKVGTTVTTENTSLDAIAASTGNNTLTDLMQLNPELLAFVIIKRGTSVRYYIG